MSNHTTQFTQLQLEFPEAKLCECGCGQPAPIAKWTNTKWGHVKGQPVRFIHSHHNKMRTPTPRPLEERFWKKVDKSGGPDACWLWVGTKAKRGYGTVRNAKRRFFAHRVSWELHNGPIPEHDSHHGMCVLHKCDNPSCVNPKHLFLGTQTDNMADMDSKNRRVRPPGLRGESDPNAKLTEMEVLKIRDRSSKGATMKTLAKEYGVCHATIWNVIHRKTWTHI